MGSLRKFLHLLGLVFPLLYLISNKSLILALLFPLSSLLLVIDVLRFKFSPVSEKFFQIFSLIVKKHEKKTFLGITYFLWGTLLTVLFFEKEIAVLALLFLVFGDVVSFYLRKIRFLAVFATCLVSGLVGLILLGMNLILPVVLIGALVATIIEALPLRIRRFYLDDNLTIPIFSALAMTLVKLLF